MKLIRLVWVLIALAVAASVHAQPPTVTPAIVSDVTLSVTVPDLTGLNPPQAAAALNAAGLRLGDTIAVTASENQPSGTVSVQNPLPDSSAAPGSAVEVLIAHTPNVKLIYDNNDLTLIYFGSQSFDVSTLQMLATGESGVRFLGERWGRSLSPGDCVQVWAIRRSEPKSVDGCRRIERWLTTADTGQHVWRRGAGVEQFIVRQNDVQRAECPAATREARDEALVCAFYVAEPDSPEVWPFVYFAYTRDTLIVRNASADGWMRLNATISPASGNSFTLNDSALYAAIDGLVLSENNSGKPVLRQLAPNQCVRFRTDSANPAAFPEPCMLFAEAMLSGVPFWMADFTVRDRDGREHRCLPAALNSVTVCRIPR